MPQLSGSARRGRRQGRATSSSRRDRGRTEVRLAGQGQPAPAARRRHRHDRDPPHRFFRREGDNIRVDSAGFDRRGGVGAQAGCRPSKGGDVSVPKGSSSARCFGQGGASRPRTAKGRPAGDSHDRRPGRAGARPLPGELERQGQRKPAGRAGRLTLRARDFTRIAGSPAQAAGQGEGTHRQSPPELPVRCSHLGSDQTGGDRRLFGRLHPRRQSRLPGVLSIFPSLIVAAAVAACSGRRGR